MNKLRFVNPRFVLAACCLGGIFYSATLSVAAFLFRYDTAASVAAAARLFPDNSIFLARLAAWNPAEKIKHLQRALALNPYDSDSWIQLGLHAEFRQQNPTLAESYYRRAAEVNHMYLPAWTLANFYFRSRRDAPFLEWSRTALNVTPYTAHPIFQQLWSFTNDAARIQASIPSRPRVLWEYADFLFQSRRLNAIPPVVQRAVTAKPQEIHSPLEATLLKAWRTQTLVQDDLLGYGLIDPALQIWNYLRQIGWIHLPTPSYSSPLTNGDFSQPVFGHGFDWIVPPINGISFRQLAEAKEIRFTFSGKQPESCPVLTQRLLLAPGQQYRLSWNAESSDVPPDQGLHWQLYSMKKGVIGALSTSLISGDLLASRPEAQAWDFVAPSDAPVALLVLEYSRSLGATRIQGDLVLSQLRMVEK